MKRIIVIVAAIFAAVSTMLAADYLEVVYLNNGSVIKGIIVEQIPGKTLTVETPDGSMVICNYDDVARITKENKSTVANKNGRSEELPFALRSSGLKAPRYRGFAGQTVTVGVGDFDYDRTSIYTTHGVQVTPHIFAGAGVAATYWNGPDIWSVPIYGAFRYEFLKRRVTPYVDAKLGYSAGDVSGLYFAPSVGGHVWFGDSKIGLSFALGYELVRTRVTEYYYGSGYYHTNDENLNGVTLSVAIDF